MLQDKDPHLHQISTASIRRISTLRAKRGAWDETKFLIDQGRDWIVDEMKENRVLRGARRRGGPFPTGLKMVVHAQAE